MKNIAINILFSEARAGDAERVKAELIEKYKPPPRHSSFSHYNTLNSTIYTLYWFEPDEIKRGQVFTYDNGS